MKQATRSIALSVVFIALVAILAAVGMGFWFFESHRERVQPSTQSAEAEFSQHPSGGQFISWVE